MSVQTMTFEEIFDSGYWKEMQQFADGILQTDDETTFRIHRVVLAIRSEYFRALFSFNLNETTFVIPNINSKVLECILLYIYTGTVIAVNEENVCDFLIASDYLLMDDLLESCDTFIIQNVTSTNCLPFLITASQVNRLTIMDYCFRFTIVFFEKILEKTNCGLADLPFEVIRKLLESNVLNVESERSVWRAIISWTETNSSTRLHHVPNLLTCLRLEEVNEDLEAEIRSHAIIIRNSHIFGNEFNLKTLKSAMISNSSSLEPRFRNLPGSYGTRMPNFLHLMAYRTQTSWHRGKLRLFLSYDNKLDFWRQIGEIGCDYRSETMVQIGQRLYRFTREFCSCFDIVEEVWKESNIALTPTGDQNFCRGIMITLGKKLYNIDHSCHSLCKISSYDFEVNNWVVIERIRNINIKGAVAFKDQIFIVGFPHWQDFIVCLAYDTVENSWGLLPHPKIFCEELSVVVFHEQMLIIPGRIRNEQSPQKVEAYDPVQKIWMSLPYLPFQYLRPKAVVVDDKIFVYEEYKLDPYRGVDPPVYWDEDAKLWRIIEKLSPWYLIERYSFIVIDDCQLVKNLTARNRRPENKWERRLV